MSIQLSDQTVSAEAVLKSRNHQSLMTIETPITAENIDQIRPTPETISEAKKLFEAEGFVVVSSGITLTVHGTRAQFAKLLGGDWEKGSPMIPKHMEQLVERIVFPEKKPIYFP
ncbi:hypothetical protein ABE137_24405 [Brevibacillus laterosporus]|uniref:Uncharacterized protein n=1 Tax=Brevibacillus halotolerans TaxID=1507437 RepID=A0ABT4HW35_9BACL|nr:MULTISPECIES: hypothetical protein [Brevibacillus]MCR8985281.1 hypothetical protein [Brevibacillus laterosporus]MCZ0831010.1 hypothetical protein [Brevibacillus halotolerans]GIO00081.1 hypothetical protein J5TS2_07490 [Brevibacillus halotolerans]